jgi:hypothetical protein
MEIKKTQLLNKTLEVLTVYPCARVWKYGFKINGTPSRPATKQKSYVTEKCAKIT